MCSFKYEIDKEPNQKETKVLRDGIINFNQSIIDDKPESFNIYVKEKNEIIAGAIVYKHRDAFYLDVLWCSESSRGKGFGSKIIRMLEEEARDKSICKLFVDTFDFQAQSFYLKNGFEVIGIIPDYLLGHDRIYMRKDIK